MIQSRRAKNTNSKEERRFRFLGVLTILVSLIFQLVLANSLAAKGREIGSLEREKLDLLSEGRDLESRLATLGSLVRVREDAFKIGMIESGENIDYLIPPKVAYQP